MAPDVAIDPVELRTSLDREMAARCQLAALAVAAWSIVSIGFDAFFAPAAFPALGLLHAGLAIVALSVRHLLRRGALPDRHASLAGFLLSTWLIGDMWFGFAASGDALYPLTVMLVLIAAACIHLHGRWVVVTAAVAALGWIALGGRAADAASHTIAFVGTAVVAAVVHLIARRNMIGVERYRQQERHIRARLESALARANHELDERIRAEGEREALREQLVHAQRLEAIGTLAGGIAHDMNNVLAAIVGFAEFARENPGQADDDLERLLAAAQRGADLTRNLLAFGRRGHYRREPIEVGEVARGALGLLSRTLPPTIEIATRFGHGDATTDGDPSQLGQALINLCINAADAMGGAGELEIATRVVAVEAERAAALAVPPGRYLALSVRDTGAGMDAATLARIFEPFYTTKPVGKGTGLGLAMVYGTVRVHGGAIGVDSEVGAGTTFTLYLPVAAQPRSSAEAVDGRSTLAGDGVVLVVDDDDEVRAVLARKLGGAGFDVVEARDGSEALTVFGARKDEIRLVVLDLLMPVMGGAACFRAIREIDPDARVLLVSGYSGELDTQACLAAGALGLLPKPFTTTQLASAIEHAVAGKKLDAAAIALA